MENELLRLQGKLEHPRSKHVHDAAIRLRVVDIVVVEAFPGVPRAIIWVVAVSGRAGARGFDGGHPPVFVIIIAISSKGTIGRHELRGRGKKEGDAT